MAGVQVAAALTQVPKTATSENVDRLTLSGLRSPYSYSSKLGIIEKGALADILLVDGDLTKDLSLPPRRRTYGSS